MDLTIFFVKNAMWSWKMIVVVITHMQEQFLSHFTVSHTDLFVGLFCFPIFPVLAGLMELETTPVAAHKPAVPLVSLPYIFLLSTTSFSLCLSPSLQQQWTHTWVSVFIACCLLFGLQIRASPTTQHLLSKCYIKTTSVGRMRWLRQHCRRTAMPR